MASQSSIFAWEIPWPEEPDGLQSTGSLRVGHAWVIKQLKQQAWFWPVSLGMKPLLQTWGRVTRSSEFSACHAQGRSSISYCGAYWKSESHLLTSFTRSILSSTENWRKDEKCRNPASPERKVSQWTGEREGLCS